MLRFDHAAAKPNGAPADGVLGQPDFTTNTASESVTAQSFQFPMSVLIDPQGHLWVADQENNRVLRFDNAAAKPNDAPADGVLGQPDFTTNTALDPPTARGLGYPAGLAVDTNNHLWVADAGHNRILRFRDDTGVTITRAGPDPTNATMVVFTLTFSKPVTGLQVSNLALYTQGNLSGATIIGTPTGSGTTWQVTVATGSGDGELRLDLENSTGVQDSEDNPVANVPYTSGEAYTITAGFQVYIPLISAPFDSLE